jgi:hypothetical protein
MHLGTYLINWERRNPSPFIVIQFRVSVVVSFCGFIPDFIDGLDIKIVEFVPVAEFVCLSKWMMVSSEIYQTCKRTLRDPVSLCRFLLRFSAVMNKKIAQPLNGMSATLTQAA